MVRLVRGRRGRDWRWIRRHLNGRIEGIIGIVWVGEVAIVVVPVLGLVGIWRIAGHSWEVECRSSP